MPYQYSAPTGASSLWPGGRQLRPKQAAFDVTADQSLGKGAGNSAAGEAGGGLPLAAIGQAVGGIAQGIGKAAAPEQVSGVIDGTDYLAASREGMAKEQGTQQLVDQGVTAAATAINPVAGAAYSAISGISNGIKASNVDKYGFRKTDTGGNIKEMLANTVNPIANLTNGFSHLGDSDYNAVEKIASFIPGGSFLTAGAEKRKRDRILETMKEANLRGAEKRGNAGYSGMGQIFRQGGRIRRFGVGGGVGGEQRKPAAAPASPPTRYTVKNPSPDAQRYYEQALPTMKRLIGQKHDEVYNDPATGKQCTANSCLSFATTIQEQSTGSTQPRTKQNLYNPEFTRTASQQGWVQVPLEQARAGDRLQYWTTYQQELNANAPAGQELDDSSGYWAKNTNDHRRDLGSQQLIPGKFPYHMMVLSSGLTPVDDKGNYWGDIVQDGHEFTAADRGRKTNVNQGSYVVYRYIGVNGAPTNDPAEAVALNPAVAQSNSPSGTTAHAAGGRVLLAKAAGPSVPAGRSLIVRGALHSEKNAIGHADAGTYGMPVIHADGGRIAEVERDEYLMNEALTERIEGLRARYGKTKDRGTLRQIGQLVAQDITTNTEPSERFARRLQAKKSI